MKRPRFKARRLVWWIQRGLVESSSYATPEVVDFLTYRQRFWSIASRLNNVDKKKR